MESAATGTAFDGSPLESKLATSHHRGASGVITSPTSKSVFYNWEVITSCPACGAPDSGRPLIRFRAQSRCAICRHVYLSPRPTQQAIADAYNRPDAYAQWLVDEKTRAVMWAKRARRLETFARGGRVLDVGAGTGAFLHTLAQSGHWHLDGTEISAQAVELASLHYGITLRHGALADFDLPGQSYDVITLWHVLEHVPNVRTTLKEVARLLAPGGMAVIAVPNESLAVRLPLVMARRMVRQSRQADLRRMMGAPVPGEEIHLHHFSRGTLMQAAHRAGLAVRYVGVDDHYPKPTWKTDTKVRIGATVLRVTRINCFPTMLLVAEGRSVRDITRVDRQRCAS
jgi:SAM-dependent methyltransferase